MGSERQYDWMWVEAREALEQAERLQRQLLRYLGPGAEAAVWEPPVDIQATPDGLVLFFALPGVIAEQIDVRLESTALAVSATRRLKLGHPNAVIRRLEIPQGRFFRRVPVPGVTLAVVATRYEDGCLEVRLTRRGRIDL